MHLVTRNVNSAFRKLCGILESHRASKTYPRMRIDELVTTTHLSETASRNGPVVRFPEPVTITYTNPLERVLFNRNRHANPFFHVIEALWMLAGRNDVAVLSRFNNQVQNYSDDGTTFHGAYGYRWKYGFRTDQLYLISNILRKDPNSRRVVLEMWSAKDLIKVQADPSCRDVPCNTHAYFDITHHSGQPIQHRTGKKGTGAKPTEGYSALNMTVVNRSNDMIWGMLGANYVHFSFLQEFLAHDIGVEVGNYHHITNNLHVYTATDSAVNRDAKVPSNDVSLTQHWLADRTPDFYIVHPKYEHVPLIQEGTTAGSFLLDLHRLWDYILDWPNNSSDTIRNMTNQPFLTDVAVPMVDAYHHYRAKNYQSAIGSCHQILDFYWRAAALDWMNDQRGSKKVSLAATPGMAGASPPKKPTEGVTVTTPTPPFETITKQSKVVPTTISTDNPEFRKRMGIVDGETFEREDGTPIDPTRVTPSQDDAPNYEAGEAGPAPRHYD